MSRLRIFFLFAALLALATAFSACGDGDGGGGGGDAETVLEDATLEGVESGVIDLSVGLDVVGEEGGAIDVSLSGPFQSEGVDRLPQLDLTLEAKGSLGGEDIDFEGGLVLLPNKAFVNYEGVDYEVDPTTFGFVEAALEEAQQKSGDEEGVTACQEAFGELKVADFAENLSEDGNTDVGGTSTTKVSGDLDISGALDALLELAEKPACSSQLGGAGQFPATNEVEKAKAELEKAVERAHVDVYVGEDDIVRRISAQVAIAPDQGGAGAEDVDVEFDLSLTEVNEEPVIAAPPGKAKPLTNLFLKLGINPIELLGLLEGQGGGLGGVLEGLGGSGAGTGNSGSGGSGTGGSGSGSGDGGAGEYADCLRTARSAADIQSCSALLE